MKKLFSILTVMLLSIGVFAATPKTSEKVFDHKGITFKTSNPVEKDKLVKAIASGEIKTVTIKKMGPHGTAVVVDGCGNVYILEWECNYNCSLGDVLFAIDVWMLFFAEC
jgi:hypothetical protein